MAVVCSFPFAIYGKNRRRETENVRASERAFRFSFLCSLLVSTGAERFVLPRNFVLSPVGLDFPLKIFLVGDLLMRETIYVFRQGRYIWRFFQNTEKVKIETASMRPFDDSVFAFKKTCFN